MQDVWCINVDHLDQVRLLLIQCVERVELLARDTAAASKCYGEGTIVLLLGNRAQNVAIRVVGHPNLFADGVLLTRFGRTKEAGQ